MNPRAEFMWDFQFRVRDILAPGPGPTGISVQVAQIQALIEVVAEQDERIAALERGLAAVATEVSGG